MCQGHGRDSKCTYWINIQNGHEQLKHEDFHPCKKHTEINMKARRFNNYN